MTARVHADADHGPLPLLETGDLHEDDFAAVLAGHLPDLPTRTGR